MPRRPVDQLNAGERFYSREFPELDVGHFGALWHLFKVGHLVTTDLDRVARRLGHSFADFDLLGTLAIEENSGMRATDLALTLCISDAVVSERVARLEQEGLLSRRRSEADKRAYDLILTPRGRDLVVEAIALITGEAHIAVSSAA